MKSSYPAPGPKQPIQNIGRALLRTFDFKGRATRSEFWWFQLFVFCVYILAMLVDTFLIEEYPVYQTAFGWSVVLENFKAYPSMTVAEVIFFVPLFSQFVRRLHDIGWTGWIALISVVTLLDYGAVAASEVEGHTYSFDLYGASFLEIFISQTGLANLILGGLTLVEFLIWLITGLRRSKPENQYGPNPWLGPVREVFS